MLKRYGITRQQYDQMFVEQKGLCKICQKIPSGRWDELCIDHDHVTGKVRGLICHNCNVGIGNFFDDPLLLEKAAEYLRKHPQT